MNNSIAQTLNLEPESDGGRQLRHQLAARWPQWTIDQPALRSITTPEELLTELPQLPRDQQDQILLSLTMLGAHDGGDDLVAATAVVACLLPGADALARRMKRSFPAVSTDDFFQNVGAHLWIAVREFHWRTASKVCGTVLWTTRNAVMREMEVGAGFAKSDKTWAMTCTDPDFCDWEGEGGAGMYEPPVDSEAELRDLLDEACGQKIITAEERRLLVDIVAAAEIHPPKRGSEWLLTNAISEQVAQERGVCAKTIRRRARRSLDALAAAATSELVAA